MYFIGISRKILMMLYFTELAWAFEVDFVWAEIGRNVSRKLKCFLQCRFVGQSFFDLQIFLLDMSFFGNLRHFDTV